MSSRPQPRAHAPDEKLPRLFPDAAREVNLITAWLWRPIRQGLETLLRFGVRPSAETILQIDVDQFPGIDALRHEQVEPRTNGPVFPEARARKPNGTIARQPSNDKI